jgi:hypothetical protein
MRETARRRPDRAVRRAMTLGALLMAVLVSCGEDARNNAAGSVTAGSTNPDLVGVWVTVPGFDDVTLMLEEDGTFTWENRSLAAPRTTGTWAADATRFTYTFAEDGRFCPGGTLTWEYQLEGDTLTSEVVATTCPGPFVPASWEFERQAGT